MSWNVAETATLKRDPNGMTLRLEDGRMLKPLRFTYTVYAEHKPLTLETSQPVTTSGYSYDLVAYDLNSLPDRFSVILQGVILDGREVTIPPLELELVEGSHYSVASL
ncbi:MAG TPA: hypothetical protein VGH91_11930 [Gammaproteobacteria bacterium]